MLLFIKAEVHPRRDYGHHVANKEEHNHIEGLNHHSLVREIVGHLERLIMQHLVDVALRDR